MPLHRALPLETRRAGHSLPDRGKRRLFRQQWSDLYEPQWKPYRRGTDKGKFSI